MINFALHSVLIVLFIGAHYYTGRAFGKWKSDEHTSTDKLYEEHPELRQVSIDADGHGTGGVFAFFGGICGVALVYSVGHGYVNFEFLSFGLIGYTFIGVMALGPVFSESEKWRRSKHGDGK